MSHGIEQTDRMFSVREAPWHILETRDRVSVLGDFPGVERGMELAGHAFEIVERPILKARAALPDWATGGMGDKVPGWKALERSDTGATLHVAKDSYEPVQPRQLWELQALLQDVEPDALKYVTAGTLKSATIMWVLAQLDEPYVVTGDDSPVIPYVLTSTSHDGSGALRADLTDVRVVCWNTYSMATESEDRSFTFRHTKNVKSRIEDARLALAGVRVRHQGFIELAEELATLPVSDEGVKRFLTKFIPAPSDYLTSDRVKANIDAARQTVEFTLNASPTVAEPHRRTAYGLFSVGIEYLDHQRKAMSADTLFSRTMLRQERSKDKVVGLVRAIAEEYAK